MCRILDLEVALGKGSAEMPIIIAEPHGFYEKLLLEKITSNPSLHAFTIHDLRRDRDKTTLYLLVRDNDVGGYLLAYAGLGKYYSVIVEVFEDRSEDIVKELLVHSIVSDKDFMGTIHVDEGFLETVAGIVKPSSVYFYYIMEYTGDLPNCDYNWYSIVELDYGLLGKYKASHEIARRVKGLRRAYGVVLGEEIVGVGGFYVMEPEVYLVGGIYVEPEYRGRGIGKAISCFLTEKALEDTGRVVLWVNIENYPAVHIYRDIGYKVIRVNAWINVNVDVKP